MLTLNAVAKETMLASFFEMPFSKANSKHQHPKAPDYKILSCFPTQFIFDTLEQDLTHTANFFLTILYKYKTFNLIKI